jgi:DNA-binding beta-propeller fold protein YncE
MKQLFPMFLLLFVLCSCAGVQQKQDEAETVFYPSLPQQPRLQYLTTINSEQDIEEPRSDFAQFVIGDVAADKIIGKPYDIGSLPGKIFILDRTFKKLLVIDLAKRQFNFLDDKGMGSLLDPSGIWISADGKKYITDMQRQQIVVFDSENNYLRSYGNKEMLARPVDVAVYQGRLYVCDMDANRVAVIDEASGELLRYFGQLQSADGSLYKPSHIDIDQHGNIFVNDAFNHQIRQFDATGVHLKSFGYHGDAVGAFARPKGLDVDRQGRLYAVDAAFENVQIFDTDSVRLLLFFGGGGTNPGDMYLPAGIHIDYANAEYFAEFADKDFQLEYLVYVGNMFGTDKLNVYGYGTWKGSELPLQ